ncbi:IS200/IS605 family element transposase accessory protein TnpB [Candidatus Woesearchaeota archaeon]|nr:IS200/IS605 family element transposase accessory protein TnpB [Candidatus Woesearchaeota archaeon]
MIVTQTVRLKLAVDGAHDSALAETVRQYATAFNAVAAAGWKTKTTNGVKLHQQTYRSLRVALDLPSQLVISARMKAVEALKSARERAKQGRKVGCPQTAKPAIRFDARSYRFDWNGIVHLTVIGGRIKVAFLLDRHSETFKGLKTHSADFVRKPKGWFLHVVVEKEVPDVQETGKTVGVDRGVKRPAVTSDGQFLGNPRWRAVEERFLALRRRLQGKGTRSARRHLARLNDRLARFHRDCDHVLSKRLVRSVSPGDTLVFEDLTNIRDNAKACGKANRRRLHSWSFARLGSFVSYKAALRSVNIAAVNPRDTSRRCPMCGWIDKKNRRTQSTFRCVRCGYERNADLVGSWNIRDRHEGLWSPVSEAPGRVNSPNVEGMHISSASPGL